MVCMHADRFVENNKTRYVDFLGAPALFPLGPFLLAAAFNAPVSFVFAFKESDTHYHLYGSKSVEKRADEPKKDYAERLLSMFLSAVEGKVKQYPDQWFNYYDFWRNAG
jgi:predicted LPLAT superfamily acyltransferase